MKKLTKLYLGLLYSLPALLFFSYYPVISIAATNSMNLELSLPLIWLVLFDFLGFTLLIISRPKLHLRQFIFTLPFPIYLSFSVFWSEYPLRGLLTSGLFWLIYLAIFFIISLKNVVKNTTFRQNLLRSFLLSSLLVSLWCWVQSFLDFLGISRDLTLMCPGCVTRSFGFPHPNGFAIEPQFMGNLMLAPALYSIYQFMKKPSKKFLCLSLFFIATLCLTFSRGAIYSFVAALTFLSIFLVSAKKSPRPLLSIPITFLALLLTLNIQGIFAALGPTNDTYLSGIAKSVSQLSLGQLDLTQFFPPAPAESSTKETVPIDTTNNLPTNTSQLAPKSSTFDGYVAESTNVRLSLNSSAFKLWQKSPQTILFGLGLGSAGTALHKANFVATPKEIVQNQYLSLLLETGLLGIIFLLMSLFVVARALKSQPDAPFIFALLLAYGLSLCFFSGLPNATHIYLLPPFFFISKKPAPTTRF